MSVRARTLASIWIGALLLACGDAPGEGAGGGPRVAGSGEAGSGRPQRVVLITLDTLRLDSFSTPDPALRQMPHTVEWAKRGAVFQHYYSASSTTLPAHASLLSGLQPWEHGATANGHVFAERHLTVAEVLRERGFRTAAVAASFPLHSRFGLTQGFEVYHDEFGEPGQDFSAVEIDEDEREGDLHSIADRINARAFELLDGLGGGDQFLWLHYFDAHAPYGDTASQDSNWFPRVLVRRLQTNPEEREVILTRSRELYGTDVQYLDARLSELYARLDQDADRFDTHVVLVSDHGEAFGEGGTFGHGKRLVLVQIHVPLVVVSPRVTPGFRAQAVGSIDVGPTLLALAGVGEAVLPGGFDLTAPGQRPREVYGMRRTFSEPCTEYRLDGSEHLLEDFAFFAATPNTFYVGNTELVTVGDTDKELKVQKLSARYREQFGEFQASLARLPVEEVDEATLRMLEQLGYAR